MFGTTVGILQGEFSFKVSGMQGGYPPVILVVLGKISSMLGLGLVHKVSEDAYTNRHMKGSFDKKECKVDNPCSKFSHATQPLPGTLVDYMYQNYGPENYNQLGL